MIGYYDDRIWRYKSSHTLALIDLKKENIELWKGVDGVNKLREINHTTTLK